MSGRARRLAVGFLTGAGIGLATLALVGLGAYVFLRTTPGNEFLRLRIERVLEDLTPYGSVTIGRVETDLWNDLAVHDVRITDEQGDTVVWVERALVDLELGELSRRIVRVPRLRLDGVLLDLELRPDGVLDLARVFGQVEPAADTGEPWQGLPVLLDLPEVVIDGLHLRYRDPDGEVARVSGVDARFSVYGREVVEIDDLMLVGLLADPGPTAVRVTGGLAYDVAGLTLHALAVELPRSSAVADGTLGEAWDVDVDVSRAHFPTLDPLIGSPGLTGSWSAKLDVGGSSARPSIRGTLRALDVTAGDVDVDLDLFPSAHPFGLSGAVVARAFHVHHLVPALDRPVVVDGAGEVTILAGSWPEDLVVDVVFDGGPQEAYGQEADALSGHFRIEEGDLTITGARVLGIVGDLDLDGTIDLVDGPMDLSVRGALLPSYLADRGLEGFGAPGQADVVVTGDVRRFDEVPVHVAGTLGFAPFRYMGRDVAFSRVDARFAADVVDGAHVGGSARVTARRGEAYTVAVAEAQVPDLRFEIPIGGGVATYDGHLVASGLSRDGQFAAEAAEGPFRVTMPSGGDLVVAAELEIGAHDVLGFPGTAGAVNAVLAGDRATFDVDLVDGQRPLLVTRGEWHLGTSRIGLADLLFSPTPRASWTATRPVALTLTDGGVAEADVGLTGELGDFELRGTVGASGPQDAALSVRQLQLDTFAELFPERVSGLSGVLDLEATVTGTATDPVVASTLDVRSLWVDGQVRWLDAEGELNLRDGLLRPQLRLGVAGEPLAVLWGAIPLRDGFADLRPAPDRPVDLSVALRPGSFERLRRVSPALQDAGLPEGELSAVLEASGPLGDPDFRLAGVAEVPVRRWPEPGRVEFDLRRDAGNVTFWADLREGFEDRASVVGTGTTRVGEVVRWGLGEGPRPTLDDPELWIDAMDVNAVLLGLPAADLARALGSDLDLGGELVGGVTVTGSPNTPTIEGGAHWLDGRVGEVAIEGGFVAVTPNADGYDVDLTLDFLGEGELVVDGAVPVRVDLREGMEAWTQGDLAVAIRGQGIPVAMLGAVLPGVRDAEGVVVVDGTIEGTLDQPEPYLTAKLEGGRFAYTPLGLRFTDIRLDMAATSRLLRLQTLRFGTEPIRRRALAGGFEDLGKGGSKVAATGTARLEEWSPSALSARVALSEGAWVAATPGAQLRLDGELTATGDWPSIAVTGALSVAQGNVRIDTASFLEAAPLELDPLLLVSRPGLEVAEREPEGPPLLSEFTADVDLDVNRSVWLELVIPWVDQLGQFGQDVTQLEIETRLGGELEARMERGEVVLVGEVDVVEGRASVLRSRFDTLEGSIIYAGSPPSNPDLDLRAEMSLTDATIDMAIQGTAEAPDIAFSSEQYGDETQILAILLTGRAPDELTDLQGQATIQSLAGLVLDSLFSGPSLGNFSIDPQGAVEVGVPVSSSLYTTSRLAPAAELNENRLSLAVEWSLSRQFVLSGGIGDQTGWADLFWELRF